VTRHIPAVAYRTLLAVAAASLPFSRHISAQVRTARLCGVVRDTGGAPVAKARVLIVETEQVAHSDSLGRYDIQTPSTGEISLQAMQIGYRAGRLRTVRVEAGESVRVDLTLGAPPNCDIDCAPLTVPLAGPRDSAPD